MTQRLTQVIQRPDTGTSVYTGLVTPMPGTPDIAVSHAVYLKKGPVGNGKAANFIRTAQIKEQGYSAVICFAQAENKKQEAILSETGWRRGPSFYCHRTMQSLVIWIKQL